MKRVKHEESTTWKECNMKKSNMEKLQHENSTGVPKTPRTAKMESFPTISNGFLNYCHKLL